MALNFPINPNVNDLFDDGTTTWEWDGTSWNLLSYDTSPNPQNAITSISGDTGTLSADSSSTALTIAGGTNVTTALVGDTLTINSSGGGGGVASNSFATIAADSTNVVASSATDTLTLTPGSNVTFAVDASNKSITINAASAGGSINFSDLADTGQLTADQVAEQAIARLIVTASGASAYRMDSHYSTANPTVYAISGTTIAFDLNSSTLGGHPFQIQDPTATQYDTGLVHYSNTGQVSTGSAAQNKTSGTLYWRVPFGISGTYRYQCTAHSPMVGGISIKAFNAI